MNTAETHEVTIFAEPIFQVGHLTVTNSLITSWAAVLIIFFIALSVRLKMKKIPGKFQHIFEVFLDGALSLCDQVTGDRKITKRVFPLALSLFVFILINNWLGLVPILGSFGFTEIENGARIFVPLFRSGTADVNTTLALSIMTVIGSNIFGIVVVGAWKTFNKYVNLKALASIPSKVIKDPSVLLVAPITFFVGILELIGEVAKVASLSFRLFGNVFAGEVLLASMGAILAYVLPGPFLFLEVFVGLIQALIFALLATVYFTIAAQDHSEDEEHAEEEIHEELALARNAVSDTAGGHAKS
jgi:F-type H+-transporting ATPase subunit a